MKTHLHSMRTAIISLLLCAISIFCITALTTDGATNLLSNPSFATTDQFGRPLDWNRGGWGTNARSFVYPVAGYDATPGVRITVSNYSTGDAKWYPKDVSIIGGTSYTFTDFYKSDVSTELLVRFTLADGSTSYKFLTTLAPSATWREATVAFMTPTDARSATIFHTIHGNGFLEIDNTSLTITGNTPPTPNGNLIPNGSLEATTLLGNPEGWQRGGWGTHNGTYAFPVAGYQSARAARVEMSSWTNGDIKWFFNDVPVTPNTTYSFSDMYRASVPTNITVRYTRNDGSTYYVGIGTALAQATWTKYGFTLTTPADVRALTVFHILTGPGWLEIDDATLTTAQSAAFMRGKVSFTFDDGWMTHYTEAYPILEQAGVKGTFYLVSDFVTGSGAQNTVTNSTLEAADPISSEPVGWVRGGWGTNTSTYTYPVPGYQSERGARVAITEYSEGDAKWHFTPVTVKPTEEYVITGDYASTRESKLVAQFTLDTGARSYKLIRTLPSSNSTWAHYREVVNIPDSAIAFSLFHIIEGVGELSIDNSTMSKSGIYANVSQMKEMMQRGHEMGGHSKSHPSLPTLDDATLRREVEHSRTILGDAGLGPILSFAYPYGDYTTPVVSAVQNGGYTSARSVDRGFNDKNSGLYTLKIQQVDRTTTLAQMQSWIDYAARTNTWLILMFHQISTNENEFYGTTPALLRDVVSYAKTAPVDIVTVTAGRAAY